MIDLRDPRWEAIGVLIAIYALILGGLTTIRGLKVFLLETPQGIALFILLLIVPIVILAALRCRGRRRKPKLSRKDKAAIREVILRYNHDFVKAVTQRDPRFLWGTVTKDAYLNFVERAYERHLTSLQQHSATVGLCSIEFLNIDAPEPGTAVARVDETWEYSYANDRSVTSVAYNRYSLEKTDNIWRIADVEHFVRWNP